MEMTRHTCLKLEIPDATDLIFQKRTRFQAHFELSIIDGLNAWLCNASGEKVKDRAAQLNWPSAMWGLLGFSAAWFCRRFY
ncbi:hypothetical protein WN944_029200 [Citrus x changshan-huyou]|uniref:XRCC4 N-terminal domain-containing protein n=1 Tax=Citrus x changshan-huyou TaxID=2935761 RepID=A0AAP0LLB2_9ROSI